MRDLLRTPRVHRLLIAAAVLLMLGAVVLTTGRPAAARQEPAHSNDALPTAPQAPYRAGAAVIAPIVAGLLLTAYAAYRHRGLPGGQHAASPGGSRRDGSGQQS
ncbi:hypothetical protein [Peterkaempfera griseoplana]|uniref:hypothetical protein n=1 Tax=Peterkaempfera griseoplana TaxID=66896 RepID=UPI0006E2A1D3|nr:hypothetical protein [Peterkaempfera griseoplana]